MHLAIDIGNTRTKYGLFKAEELIEADVSDKAPVYIIKELYELHPDINAIVLCSVNKNIDPDLVPIPETIHHVILNPETRLPLINRYVDKHSLGADRLAAAVAAAAKFPGNNVLVIDAGTCITYEFVDASNTYQGGAIAPGLRLRLEAMHRGTSSLPLLPDALEILPDMIGSTTAGSMYAGAARGMLHEINGTISAFREKYIDLQVVLTGGNASLFESGIKSPIFADPNFVLRGLHQILLFNLPEA